MRRDEFRPRRGGSVATGARLRYSPKRTKGAANVEGPQGATAIKIELSGYDSYEIQQESEQNWGLAIREVYVVAFIAVLVVQSFRINKATKPGRK